MPTGQRTLATSILHFAHGHKTLRTTSPDASIVPMENWSLGHSIELTPTKGKGGSVLRTVRLLRGSAGLSRVYTSRVHLRSSPDNSFTVSFCANVKQSR